MKFERTRRDGCFAKPISPVSEAQIRRALSHKPTVCILTKSDGSYLQTGRSGFCCCLEWHDRKSRHHYRALQRPPVAPWPGVTSIFLLSGEVFLMQEEYFSPQQLCETLVAFLRQEPFPAYIQWRDITDELNAKGCALFAHA